MYRTMRQRLRGITDLKLSPDRWWQKRSLVSQNSATRSISALVAQQSAARCAASGSNQSCPLIDCGRSTADLLVIDGTGGQRDRNLHRGSCAA